MTLKKTSIYIVIVSLACVAILQVMRPVSGGVIENPIQAPEFTHTQADDWLNSPPLSLADLRGNVVLMDFWAFECWNCYRDHPGFTVCVAIFICYGDGECVGVVGITVNRTLVITGHHRDDAGG